MIVVFNPNPEIPRVLEDIPEPEQRALLEKAATWIVRRGLTAPAILFLEIGKPLNFLGSQLLIAFSPFIQAVSRATSTINSHLFSKKMRMLSC